MSEKRRDNRDEAEQGRATQGAGGAAPAKRPRRDAQHFAVAQQLPEASNAVSAPLSQGLPSATSGQPMPATASTDTEVVRLKAAVEERQQALMRMQLQMQAASSGASEQQQGSSGAVATGPAAAVAGSSSSQSSALAGEAPDAVVPSPHQPQLQAAIAHRSPSPASRPSAYRLEAQRDQEHGMIRPQQPQLQELQSAGSLPPSDGRHADADSPQQHWPLAAGRAADGGLPLFYQPMPPAFHAASGPNPGGFSHHGQPVQQQQQQPQFASPFHMPQLQSMPPAAVLLTPPVSAAPEHVRFMEFTVQQMQQSWRAYRLEQLERQLEAVRRELREQQEAARRELREQQEAARRELKEQREEHERQREADRQRAFEKEQQTCLANLQEALKAHMATLSRRA